MSNILSNIDNYLDRPKISVSEHMDLSSCLKKHDYAYRQGLRKIQEATYLTEGSFLHKLMEHCFKDVQTLGEPPAHEQINTISMEIQSEFAHEGGQTIGEHERKQIVDQVQRFWSTDLNFEVLMTEAEFYVDLGWSDGTVLHGKIDAVVREHATGNIWIVEHKRTSRAWPESKFTYDIQGPMYALALKALFDWDVQGILYNFFYTPKKTRSDMETRPIYITPAQMMTWHEEFATAIDLRNSNLITRQVDFMCGSCWFAQLCNAEIQGEDTELLKATTYTIDDNKKARFDD